MLISEGQGVYLLILSVQQHPVDLAGQVTPQSLGLLAGPGYLYPLSVLAYLDLGHQGSPFLLLLQEILEKAEDTGLVLNKKQGKPLIRISDHVHL